MKQVTVLLPRAGGDEGATHPMKREAVAVLLGYLQAQREVFRRILEQIGALDLSNQERTIAVGYYLHHLYSACEDLMGEIASTFENRVEDRRAYHRQLLLRMSIEVPTVRPHVFSPDSTALLDELRAFRHVFPLSDTYSLDAGRLAALREKVLAGWHAVEHDLNCFEEFLQRLLSEEQTDSD